MKQLLPVLIAILFLIGGFSVKSQAQIDCTTTGSWGEPCANGCTCWSRTSTCTGLDMTLSCGVSGGSCDYGDVIITWTNEITCA